MKLLKVVAQMNKKTDFPLMMSPDLKLSLAGNKILPGFQKISHIQVQKHIF